MSSRRPVTERVVARSVVLAVLVGLLGAGPASARPRPTQAARGVASRSSHAGLLRRSDLGAGWTETAAAPRHPPSLACGAAGSATASGVLASMASPTWGRSSGGPFASGTSYGFGSAADALRAFSAVARTTTGRCFERLLAQGSTGSVMLRATGVREFALPRVTVAGRPVSIRRFRVSGIASGAGQETQIYLDGIIVARGSAIAVDEFSSVTSPPSTALEMRVTAAQARRLAGAG
jgi:hypothetical protein